VPKVTRTIELHEPVDTIHEQWTTFEGLPSYHAHQLVAGVQWRAEVLTLEPMERGTRLTLRIEYVPDPVRGDGGLAARMERVLRSFASFVAMQTAGASAPAAP
jgi:hypothetical protein